MSSTHLKIVLTGASGKLGGLVLTELLKTLPPTSIGISARDPSKLTNYSSQGIRVLQGSYDDPTALTAAFSGADTVLIISSNDRSGGAQQHHRNAIDSAQAAGVRRVFYTSHQGASPTSLFGPMPDHAATEAYLEGSGLEYVSLRNGFYMDTILMFLRGVESTGAIKAPKDGKVSWTAHEDLAKTTAKLLLSEEKLEKIITLASDQTLDLDDVAKVYGEVQGKEIKREVQEWEPYKENLVGRGVPEPLVMMLKGMFAAAEAGEFISKDQKTLKGLIGGELTTVKGLLQRQ